jgi:integrase
VTSPDEPEANKRTRRRKKGRGSIYQRSDGRWCAELTVENGRRKFIYGATAGDVERKLTAAKSMIDAGGSVGDDRLTVGMVLDKFIDEREHRVRARTIESYRYLVKHHIKPHIGSVRARTLSPADVQSFIAHRLRAKVSASLLHHVLAVLRMAFKLAVRWGLVLRNPADAVRGPKVERKELSPLDAEATKKLLVVAAKEPLGGIWLLAASLGLRRGEILGLTWDDVDLDAATLVVRHQLQGAAKKAKLVAPKTKRAMRELSLSSGVVALLKERKRQQATEKLAAGEKWEDKLDLIFTGERGQALEGASVTKMHRRLCKDAEVRTVRFHDLRHGAATLMLEAGVDPATLSATLGHSRVAFTLDTYVHATRRNLDDAVDKLANVLKLK